VALPLTVTVQVAAVPVQAPVQLTKVKPASGVAVNVTAAVATLAEQTLPQLILPGVPVTRPRRRRS
jgi:hypothetical protein